MKFFADENVYEPVIEYLRRKGHEVISGRAPGLSGATDDQVFRQACKDQLTIVTFDKDFLRLKRFPPHLCGGIIVVKIYRRSVRETTELFIRSFESLPEERIKDHLVIITVEGVRFRTDLRVLGNE